MSIYERYTKLYHAMMEHYRLRIVAADPRVGLDGAFHHTHNWGNDAARALLTLCNKRTSQLLYRRGLEYRRARDKAINAVETNA